MSKAVDFRTWYKPIWAVVWIWTGRMKQGNLHMDGQTAHIHIDFVLFIGNSKRGLDTRVSLKGALSEQGFKGGKMT